MQHIAMPLIPFEESRKRVGNELKTAIAHPALAHHRISLGDRVGDGHGVFEVGWRKTYLPAASEANVVPRDCNNRSTVSQASTLRRRSSLYVRAASARSAPQCGQIASSCIT